MRALFALLLTAAAFASACGGADPGASPPTNDAEEPESIRPTSPAPKLDMDGPPPAWIETEREALWLAYSTYCWETACADYIPPACGDEKLAPTIEVRRGDVVRFHLGFRPKGRVTLQFFAEGKEPRARRIGKSQDPTWKVRRGGAFWIGAASGGSRSANYAGCFKIVDA